VSGSKLSPEERVAALETKLGLPLGDKKLALASLTHKSYCNEHRDEGVEDNERLEFLGDAVVDLVVSQALMQRFPQADEGELSKLRAVVVNEEGLGRVARAMGLGELLLLGRGEDRTGGRTKGSVLADALEAVIGAVFLTDGLVGAAALVERHFAGVLAGLLDGKGGEDFKTRLQEEVQKKLHLSPRYRVVGEVGPDHDKVFTVEVSIDHEAYGRGEGRNKKEAEQAAAQKTLEMLAGLVQKA
jgi:ribonuclease-3